MPVTRAKQVKFLTTNFWTVEQHVEALVKGKEYKCDRSQKHIHIPVLKNIFQDIDLQICLCVCTKHIWFQKHLLVKQKGFSSSWVAVWVLIFQHQQVSQSIFCVAKWSYVFIYFHRKDSWTAVFKLKHWHHYICVLPQLFKKRRKMYGWRVWLCFYCLTPRHNTHKLLKDGHMYKE